MKIINRINKIRNELDKLTDRVERNVGRVGRNAKIANDNKRLDRDRIAKLEAQIYSLRHSLSVLALGGYVPSRGRVGKWESTTWLCSGSHWSKANNRHAYVETECKLCGDVRPGVWI